MPGVLVCLFAAAITAATTSAATAVAAITAGTATAAVVGAAAAVIGSNGHFRRRYIARLWSKQVDWEIQVLEEFARIAAFWRYLGCFFRYAGAQVLHHHVGKTEQFYHSKQTDGYMHGHWRRRASAAARRRAFAAIDDGVVAAIAAVAAAATVVASAVIASTAAVGWARIAQAGRKRHGIGFYANERTIAADGREQFVEGGHAHIFSAIQGQIGGIAAGGRYGRNFAAVAIIEYQAILERKFDNQIPIAALEGAFCFADNGYMGSIQVFNGNRIGIAGRHDIFAVGATAGGAARIVAGIAVVVAGIAVVVAAICAVVVAGVAVVVTAICAVVIAGIVTGVARVVAAAAARGATATRTVARAIASTRTVAAAFFAALAFGCFAGSTQNVRRQANLQPALIEQFLCHNAVCCWGSKGVVTSSVSIHRGSSFFKKHFVCYILCATAFSVQNFSELFGRAGPFAV